MRGKAKADVRGRKLNVAWFYDAYWVAKQAVYTREPEREHRCTLEEIIGVHRREPVYTGRKTGVHW